MSNRRPAAGEPGAAAREFLSDPVGVSPLSDEALDGVVGGGFFRLVRGDGTAAKAQTHTVGVEICCSSGDLPGCSRVLLDGPYFDDDFGPA